jgi:AraC-like DNA-binding protein
MTVDPISEALQDFGMTGVFYCSSDLAAPWGIELPPFPGTVMFHLLTAGSAIVEVEGVRTPLMQGQLLLVPHGTGHAISSDADSAATPLFDLPREETGERYERLRIDGGGAPAGLLCGAVSFSGLAVSRLMQSLPPVLLAGHATDAEWLRATVEVMGAEAKDPRPGSDVLSARLADVLVVHAVRAWLETTEPERGWVAALRDPYLGRALAAFHADPAQQWGLASLAAEAGMSRSAFAARFSELVGEPPMTYVTSWRMDLAARLVRDGDLTLAGVAERVGYRSEAAFNRAFRRAHGATPGAVRRRGRTSFGEIVEKGLQASSSSSFS